MFTIEITNIVMLSKVSACLIIYKSLCLHYAILKHVSHILSTQYNGYFILISININKDEQY